MLDRIAEKGWYCFLYGYLGYNQISIVPEDQEKTTFTCPYGTFALKRMTFGFCNAPTKFKRCMMSIFSDMVDDTIEVFLDDFSVWWYCFLDGYSGYNQISIALEEQEKTTFTCPYGTFMFKRMPFGLCNAPTTFQRCMVSIFSVMAEDTIEAHSQTGHCPHRCPVDGVRQFGLSVQHVQDWLA
uniref:Reverse transcriptase domain-containing protein n=1 Tax=Solanum lycopersicum TaxID=4081 RepID=A0A3Q7H761_SOLLC